jgi:hypothetical protein
MFSLMLATAGIHVQWFPASRTLTESGEFAGPAEIEFASSGAMAPEASKMEERL